MTTRSRTSRRGRSPQLWWIVTPLLLVWMGCSAVSDDGGTTPIDPNAPIAKGNRELAIDVKEASDGDWTAALQVALDAGADDVKFSFDWDALENGFTGGGLDLATILDLTMPHYASTVTLILRPINTVALTYPSGVPQAPLDNPTAVAAFAATIDTLHARLPAVIASGKLVSIVVGNEVDVYLGENAALWSSFQTFYDAARQHILSLDWGNPSLAVSTVVTFGEMQDPVRRTMFTDHFGTNLDDVRINYYPLQSDFTVRPPDSPITDFATISSWFPSHSIVIQECGYQSSSVCNSSEEMQRQFIANAFAAWDQNADRIRHIDFAWLTDVSATTLDEWMGYYGFVGSPDEARFRGYLGSLGLRHYDGSEKPAMAELRAQAAARGW